jgi:hypothetical protein
MLKPIHKDKVCPICIQAWIETEPEETLYCGHVYHKKCISTWGKGCAYRCKVVVAPLPADRVVVAPLRADRVVVAPLRADRVVVEPWSADRIIRVATKGVVAVLGVITVHEVYCLSRYLTAD